MGPRPQHGGGKQRRGEQVQPRVAAAPWHPPAPGDKTPVPGDKSPILDGKQPIPGHKQQHAQAGRRPAAGIGRREKAGKEEPPHG
jgi:hypothetical protein